MSHGKNKNNNLKCWRNGVRQFLSFLKLNQIE